MQTFQGMVEFQSNTFRQLLPSLKAPLAALMKQMPSDAAAHEAFLWATAVVQCTAVRLPAKPPSALDDRRLAALPGYATPTLTLSVTFRYFSALQSSTPRARLAEHFSWLPP